MRGMSKNRTRSVREIGQALGDVGTAHALALGHAELGQLEDGLRLAPGRQREGHVASHDERQLVSRAAVMQPVAGYRP